MNDRSKMSRMQTMMFFLRGSKRWFALGVACSLFVAFLDMIGPKIVQFTVDHVIGSEEISSAVAGRVLGIAGGRDYLRSHLYVVALAVIVIALTAGIIRYLYRVFNSMGAERLIKRMRDELFIKIQHLPVRWHEMNHTGDIIQRCTSDVETIKNFLSEQLMSLFRVMILIGFGMYFMIGISGRLAMVSGAFIPIVILYSVFFHFKIAGAFLHADEEEGRLSAIAQENLTGIRVVRAFGREQYERKRFKDQNEGYTRMWIRLMGWLSAFWCSNDFITGLQIMLVTVFGAVFCVQGRITVGEYIAFSSYNGMLSWPVRELGRVISDMSKAVISVDRIRYVMNSVSEDAGDMAAGDNSDTDLKPMSGLPDKPLDVSFEHVTFSYDGIINVIKDVSFDVPAGTTLGILGATGSGKSTLMLLLDRIYELPAGGGCIRIGGVDVRDVDRHALRQYVGLVLQEPFLFSGTIAENIAITHEGEPDMELVRSAARTAALDEAVTRFADGYDTYVGERGVTLSGGQKQRTAIAREIALHPPVMIFDDSLSAVDTETDVRIRRALRETTGGSTVILISHRITTLMQADRIIVLDRGRIAESGTHAELLERGGIYRRIYDIQTAGVRDYESV